MVTCRAGLLTGGEDEAARAVVLLREKYRQYREMELDGNPVIKLIPQRYTAWSFSGE